MGTTKIFLGNIKGPAGKDGFAPVKNVDYFDGKDGKDGKDGATGPQGPKGDPFRYEDFTPAQIDELANKIVPDVLLLSVANVCYVCSVPPASGVGEDGDICIIRG